MNIPNKHFGFNSVCRIQNKQIKKEEQNTSEQTNISKPIAFGNSNILQTLIMADVLTGGGVFGRPTSHHKPEKSKPQNEPYRMETSNMDLKRLNEELCLTETKIEGNRVYLKNNSWGKEYEQTANIPEEYFEECETDQDKEYLIKRWLVESKKDYNLENIPYELMRAADDVHFYNVDNHRSQMKYDAEAREKGIIIGKLEKSDTWGEPSYINFEIDGKKYKEEIGSNIRKYDVICAASGHESFYSSNSMRNMFKNILESQQGRFVKEGKHETFVPKLKIGVPNFEDKKLLMYGTSDEKVNQESVAYNYLKDVVGDDIESDNVKIIKYAPKTHSNQNEALSYYDENTNTQYLYYNGNMYKQLENGEILKKQMEHLCNYDWETVIE